MKSKKTLLIFSIVAIAILVLALRWTIDGNGYTENSDSRVSTYQSCNFTIVVLPDTQKYSESYPSIFTNQTQWISNQKTSRNIQYVSQLGDLTENNIMSEWDNANTSMSVLDDMPYSVLPGNHDVIGGSTGNYNTYFPYSRYTGKSWYGGHYGTTNDNNYILFKAGGMDFITVNLEYDPSVSVRNWASDILYTYSDRRAIVNTHSYLNTHGTRTAIGDNIWNDVIVPNNNVFMVLCGHIHGEARSIASHDGIDVYQVLQDYQSRRNGGNGWLRLFEFDPSSNIIRVRTYSSYLDSWETDSDSQFTLNVEVN